VGADFAGLRPALERRASDLGLNGRVRFLGGISDQELFQVLERAQLFVSASSYEGFGLSTVEAMSAATVPVVTAVGVHPVVVRDGVTGFLTDQDASGLVMQLDRALLLPEARLEQMGEAARAATKRFSWSSIAPHYEQLYREVLHAQGPCGGRKP
jgi:alpha-1,3-mannosyltransferase